MASNFKISTHFNSENVHFQLIGDFDGISAQKLLELLEKSCDGMHKIFIHTNCLKRIHPFGCNVFHKHLQGIKSPAMQIVFTGDHANRMAPQ